MYKISINTNPVTYRISDNIIPSQSYIQYTESNNIPLHKVKAYVTTAYNIMNSHFLEKEIFLFKALINQRKVHRYYKAITELEHSLIDNEEFNKIEKSCILSVKNVPEENLKAKIFYFYEMMKKYSPEEIDFINNEDLSELFSVPEHKVNIIHYKLENA